MKKGHHHHLGPGGTQIVSGNLPLSLRGRLPQQTSSASHSWEPCPPAPSAGWDHQQASLAQRGEQTQLLWALTDKTGPPHQRAEAKAPQPCAHTLRKPVKATSSPPRPKHHPKGPAVVSKANATQSKPQPQATRRTNGEDSEEFDPPARPGAHPKKCPVQQPASVIPPLFHWLSDAHINCGAS